METSYPTDYFVHTRKLYLQLIQSGWPLDCNLILNSPQYQRKDKDGNAKSSNSYVSFSVFSMVQEEICSRMLEQLETQVMELLFAGLHEELTKLIKKP